MLNVEFFVLKDGKILGFNLVGHCGYSQSGTDIVCAAISSAVYMVINTITDIIKVNIKDFFIDNGQIKAIIHEKDESTCRVLFNGLKLHLLGLEEAYPKNIKVCYVEV